MIIPYPEYLPYSPVKPLVLDLFISPQGSHWRDIGGIHGIVTIPFFEPETLGVIDLTVFGWYIHQEFNEFSEREFGGDFPAHVHQKTFVLPSGNLT